MLGVLIDELWNPTSPHPMSSPTIVMMFGRGETCGSAAWMDPTQSPEVNKTNPKKDLDSLEILTRLGQPTLPMVAKSPVTFRVWSKATRIPRSMTSLTPPSAASCTTA